MQVSFSDAIRLATEQAMGDDSKIFAFGEGINDPGGFFGTTVGLANRFSPERCFDVPNSEECLTGFALGAALLGYRPLFVNLRADFLMLAMNQIVNHLAKWGAMSGGQCTAPVTIRAIVGREWGQAAQHSGAHHSLFAHIPGLQVVLPSSVTNAAGLLLSSIQSNVPTIILESKLLYNLSDELALPVKPIPLGKASVEREGTDLTVFAVSEMVEFALGVADAIERDGFLLEVIDLRTVQPLDEAAIVQSISKTHRAAVFDIGWEKFGLTSEIARVICSRAPNQLQSPLIGVGQKWEHTPASCFLEYDHYPTLNQVAHNLRQILHAPRGEM